MIDIYCKDAIDLLKEIPDECVDLILTDPPYGINYKDWDEFDFVPFTEKWVKESMRILKPTGTMWSFMGYQHIFDFVPILKRYGNLHLENWVVWARQKGRGSSKHLTSQREDIFHITKSDKFIWQNFKVLKEIIVPYSTNGVPHGWFIDENGKHVRWSGLGNVWVYLAPWWNSKLEKQKHPAQKPIRLMERLVLLSSNENDIVVDPFLGSGTTALACKKLNRNFIGCDINQEYIDIAKKRLEEEQK